MEIPETRYTRCDGIHIGYQLVGDGPIDLLYTGGFLLSFESYWEEPAYTRFIRRLASFSRLIMFDRRGTGVSDPVSIDNPPTLEQWADDALAVLDEVRSEKTALFGFGGIGGPVATVFAATHPERTTALVLVNSTAEGGRHRELRPGEVDPGADSEEALERMRSEWGKRDRDISRLVPSRVNDKDFRIWLAKAYRQGAGPAMAMAVGRVMRDTDIRSVLPMVSVPTLVMHRAESAFPDQGRYLADHIANARFVELDGTDHLVWTEDFGPMLDEIQEFVTGDKPEPETDRVLATVLFSDIVSSTEQAAAVGDRRWKDRLEMHDAAVRRELQRFRGHEVKTTGDGFLATFDGPARAIRCAVATHEATDRMDLTLRIGVHTGEVERRGEDVAGLAVHIGQRVSALAGPGEILVSRTVTDLVAGSGLEFEERGDHELKGVPGRWALYAVKF
jgi:class 3 adenylate cyclase